MVVFFDVQWWSDDEEATVYPKERTWKQCGCRKRSLPICNEAWNCDGL